ncbi:MAG: hypothetical protein JW828_11100 [Sedimentisphaerales bacterium]|nr:hypothetical protein [Sedimentisphaerales bacterium]
MADWQASLLDDGIVSQDELNWQYGYISNYTGMNGMYFGWHESFFFWDAASGIKISWPSGQIPPSETWGEGGDTTGSRPPMSWSDGCYAWADGVANQYAATRCWTSDYTGPVRISGKVGRYFDRSVVTGYDVVFQVMVNAATLMDPALYSLTIVSTDTVLHEFTIDNVSLQAGDKVFFLVNATNWNASNSYMKLAVTISEAAPDPFGDLDLDRGVSLRDFALFENHWRQTGCLPDSWCGGADLNRDGVVDTGDLQAMTAHWAQKTYLPTDYNHDRYVNLQDLSMFQQQWLRSDCYTNAWCQDMDKNRDGIVNLFDFAAMTTDWLQCTDPGPPCNY